MAKVPIHASQVPIEIRQALQRLNFSINQGLKNNLTAIVDPTVTDDITEGYQPGSMWFNQVLDTFWIMEVNTVGAAEWTLIIGGGGLLDFDKVESHVTLLALDANNEITFTE